MLSTPLRTKNPPVIGKATLGLNCGAVAASSIGPIVVCNWYAPKAGLTVSSISNPRVISEKPTAAGDKGGDAGDISEKTSIPASVKVAEPTPLTFTVTVPRFSKRVGALGGVPVTFVVSLVIVSITVALVNACPAGQVSVLPVFVAPKQP